MLLSFEGSLLLAAILTPLVLAAGLLSRRYRRWILWLVPFAAMPAVLLAFNSQPGTRIDLPWILLGMHLGLDATGKTFLQFTSLLWLLAGIFARGYLADDLRIHRFFAWFLLTMAGNLGLVVALDMTSFYLCFAVMSLSGYGIIVHDRSAEAFHAGKVYMVLVVLGEVALFSGMALATMARGSQLFEWGAAALASDPTLNVTVGLLLIGFGIKVGIMPLHVWLPLAHPAAPTPASAVLSGVMIKAGLLGWMRFLPVGEASFPQWGSLCLIVGCLTAICAAVIGVTQSNAKSVLAYSSISQMGVLTLGLGAGLLVPEAWPTIMPAMLVYALHHSFSKGCLFLSVGVTASPSDTRWRSRLLKVALLIPALAMAGAPMTIGAVAKNQLKYSLDALPDPWTPFIDFLLPLVAIGTTLLMARFLYLIWPGRSSSADHGHGPTLGYRSPLAVAAWLTLMFAVVSAAWMVPGLPTELSERIQSGGSLLGKTLAWVNLWPVCVGAVIAWIGWQLSRAAGMPRMPAIPPGDMLGIWLWAAKILGRPMRSLTFRPKQIRATLLDRCSRLIHDTSVRECLGRAEASMTRWPWIGLALAILFGASRFWR